MAAADEDFEENSEDGVSTPYQLGFAERGRNELFHSPNWNDWDGGRVGGFPVWLNPRDLPSPSSLLCTICSEPMKFLLQIYCPLDDNVDAFHRALYIFCCRRASCVSGKQLSRDSSSSSSNSSSSSSNSSIRCFRTQLPQSNAFYSGSISVEAEATAMSASKVECQPPLPLLCELCGCRAPNVCSRCGKAAYCSRIHQKQDWKLQHKQTCFDSVSSGDVGPQRQQQQLRREWCFPEFDLSVCAEELMTDDAAALEASTCIWDDAETEGGEDEAEDAKLTQADYDQALGSEQKDPVYIRFLARVRRGGAQQVLRYCRWNQDAGPLHITTAAAAKSNSYSPTPCEHCGAPRAFEFQIMPQLIHYLQVDRQTSLAKAPGNADEDIEDAAEKSVFTNTSDEDLDWGTIDIYTCTRSCTAANSSYVQETVLVQAPVEIKPLLGKEQPPLDQGEGDSRESGVAVEEEEEEEA